MLNVEPWEYANARVLWNERVNEMNVKNRLQQTMNKSLTRTGVPVWLLLVVVLLAVCGYAQAGSNASSSVYELTVKACSYPSADAEVLQIHQLVQPDVPFSFITNGRLGHLSVTGKLREESRDHFYVEIKPLDAFGMSAWGRMCDSQETRKMRQTLKGVIPEIYHEGDPPEGEYGWGAIYGPSFKMKLKKALLESRMMIASSEGNVIIAGSSNFSSFALQRNTNLNSRVWNTNLPAPNMVDPKYTVVNSSSATQIIPPPLAIAVAGQNVILTWPTNTGLTLQSTTNFASPVWTTNLPAPTVVNGQYTVTNPISGTQHFFRLSQ